MYTHLQSTSDLTVLQPFALQIWSATRISSHPAHSVLTHTKCIHTLLSRGCPGFILSHTARPCTVMTLAAPTTTQARC